jgi:hypothetical protein
VLSRWATDLGLLGIVIGSTREMESSDSVSMDEGCTLSTSGDGRVLDVWRENADAFSGESIAELLNSGRARVK